MLELASLTSSFGSSCTFKDHPYRTSEKGLDGNYELELKFPSWEIKKNQSGKKYFDFRAAIFLIKLNEKGHKLSQAQLKILQLQLWLEPARLKLITSNNHLFPGDECVRRFHGKNENLSIGDAPDHL